MPGLTVFYGDEGWFGTEALRVIRGRFLGADGEGYLPYDAPRSLNDKEGTTLGVALDEARTFPMFGGRKVIRYRARSLDDDDVAQLVSLAPRVPEFARVVVLLASLGAGAAKKLEAAGAALGAARRLFDTPWEGRPEWDTALNKWTAERSRARGKRMTLAAAHALTSLTGNDLEAVDGALRNLSVAAGDRPEIDEDTVRDLIGGGREYGAFAFGEAIYTRDGAKALTIARNAFREGLEDRSGRRVRDAGFVAGRLLWSVGFRLKDVYRVAAVLADGASDEEAERACGKRGPIAKRLVRQARGFTPDELLRHWVLLADAEAELRTPVPAPVIVERLIGTVTEAAR